MRASPEKVAELKSAGWVPVDDEHTLFINKDFFDKGVVHFLDPSGYNLSPANGPLSLKVSKTRNLQFLEKKSEQQASKADQVQQQSVVRAEDIERWIEQSKKPQSIGSLQDEKHKKRQEKFPIPISRHMQISADVTLDLIRCWIDATNKRRTKIRLNYLLKRIKASVARVIADTPKASVGLYRIDEQFYHTNEVYTPKVVKNDRGAVTAALYVNTRHLGQEADAKFDIFHSETCLFGSQLSCRTDTGSTRHFTKHNVKFYPGEKIIAITSLAGENAYESMQFEELKIMSIMMAKHSEVGVEGRPKAKVIHHLPWLDYILSGVLLWFRGRMTYRALFSLCEIIIAKKIEHETKIRQIYGAQGLLCEFITPFSNLLDPAQELTPESVLNQLSVENVERSTEDALPQTFDMQGLIQAFSGFFKQAEASPENRDSPVLIDILKYREQLTIQLQAQAQSKDQEFVAKFLKLLQNNQFNKDQQQCWCSMAKLYEQSGGRLNTLENLLDLGNALVVALARSFGTKTCSFVSTQGKRIQVIYEKLARFAQEQGENYLSAVTCWTSVPLFLGKSLTTDGPTFYFEYAGFAEVITALLERGLVQTAVLNIAAFAESKPGFCVNKFLNPRLSSVGLLEASHNSERASVFAYLGPRSSPHVIQPAPRSQTAPIVGFFGSSTSATVELSPQSSRMFKSVARGPY